MFIGYENGCKHSLHHVIDWKTRLEHWLSCKLQKENPAMLPVLLAANIGTWRTFGDVITFQ